jgi:hypothetical protein
MALTKSHITGDASEQNPTTYNPVPCHSKGIPVWLVMLDNILTLLLFVLGFLIVLQISLLAAIAFGIYTLISVVWFWAKICPYCHFYI